MWWLRYAVPSVFEPQFTFTAWTALVLGGIASRFGAVLGVAVLLLFTELVEQIPVPLEFRNVLVAVHPLAIGLLLVLVLRFRPEGLLSERRTFGARARTATPLDRAGAAVMARLRRLGQPNVAGNEAAS